MSESLDAKALDALEEHLILSEICDCPTHPGGLCSGCHHAHEIVEAGGDLIKAARALHRVEQILRPVVEQMGREKMDGPPDARTYQYLELRAALMIITETPGRAHRDRSARSTESRTR